MFDNINDINDAAMTTRTAYDFETAAVKAVYRPYIDEECAAYERDLL